MEFWGNGLFLRSHFLLEITAPYYQEVIILKFAERNTGSNLTDYHRQIHVSSLFLAKKRQFITKHWKQLTCLHHLQTYARVYHIFLTSILSHQNANLQQRVVSAKCHSAHLLSCNSCWHPIGSISLNAVNPPKLPITVVTKEVRATVHHHHS